MSIPIRPYPKPIRKKRAPLDKPRTARSSVPLEEDEQQALVDWLDLHGIMYQTSSMGLFMPLPTRMKFKKMGCKANHPDIIIYDRPCVAESGTVFVGAAIELKRVQGGDFRHEQKQYLEELRDRGWAVMEGAQGEVISAKGADAAIDWLKSLGYGQSRGKNE